jgi:tyrosine-protein kinase Etk/Wzc
MEEKQITLIDYLKPLIKYRRFIIWFWIIAVVLSVLISLILPKTYIATAIIAPPSSSGDVTSLLSGLGVSGGMGNLAAMMLGVPTSADFYIDILHSRTVADALIDRFKLMDVYHKRYRVDTVKALDNRTEIAKTKGDLVTITVEDKDPKQAADMANAYVEELDKLARQLGMSSAGRMRVFLEKQIGETKRELRTAEDNLRNFQTEHKMVAVDEQTKAMVEGAALLEGQLIAAQTELGILRSFSTENNPRVRLVNAKIAELKKQMNLMEGTAVYPKPGKTNTLQKPTPAGTNNSFYIPLSQLPNLGLEFVRLYRDVKIQETVFELLTQQYEMARVNEAKDTQTIQIVDRAKIPDKKDKPKRSIIVLITAIVAFGLAIFIAFSHEYLNSMDAENKRRWDNLKREFRKATTVNTNNQA